MDFDDHSTESDGSIAIEWASTASSAVEQIDVTGPTNVEDVKSRPSCDVTTKVTNPREMNCAEIVNVSMRALVGRAYKTSTLTAGDRAYSQMIDNQDTSVPDSANTINLAACP